MYDVELNFKNVHTVLPGTAHNFTLFPLDKKPQTKNLKFEILFCIHFMYIFFNLKSESVEAYEFYSSALSIEYIQFHEYKYMNEHVVLPALQVIQIAFIRLCAI